MPVYTTDDSIQAKDTPTRKIQRKYRNRAGETEVMAEPGMEEEEQYGTPTFYSHEDTLAETVHQSEATKENRPILTILREILNSNKSLEMSAKDVANGTKGGPSHYDIARHFNKQRTFEEVTTMGHIRNVNIYKHGPAPPAGMPHGAASTLKPFTLRHKPLTTSAVPGAEASDNSEAGPDYEDKFKQIWPYRTDDKYSLFYFHPDRGQERGEGAEYPWPALSDPEDEVYSHEYGDYEARQADTEGDNLNREPGQSTDRWVGLC